MQESALLVGSSNGSTSLICACLEEFQLEPVLGEPGDVFCERDVARHALLVCELPLPGHVARASSLRTALQLVQAVRPLCPATPLVLVSGPEEEAATDLGADEWVGPPVSREPLVRAITGALLKREMALQAAVGTPRRRDRLTRVAEGLTRYLEAADKLTDGHASSVAGLAGKLADQQGLDRAEARAAKLAGALHDLGKVEVRQAVLDKPGALTSAEWCEMRRHPEAGAAILSRVEAFADVAGYVLHHHERHDGNGYPAGLRNGQIPVVSRIVAVADAYDAMVTPRPYRPCGDAAFAAREFRAHSGKQWDTEVVRGLFACVPELCA